VEDAFSVEPERVDADYSVPSPCFILLLVIDHPEFSRLVPDYTHMSGPEDAVSLVDDRIVTVFGKGPRGCGDAAYPIA